MKLLKKAAVASLALCMSITAAVAVTNVDYTSTVEAADAVNMEWSSLRIGGGGFVSGIVTGQKAMYARTDVGGAYRYNYETDSWEQLLGFLNEADRGLLSVDAMAIDPTDDDTAYFLCGCAYFSSERTVIFKTTDGGKTFEQTDVTSMIQVHANGNGRQTGESIAVDPDNPNIIYCGGDVYAGDSCLIKSTDGGKTWNTVKSYGDLGLYQNEIKWPQWTENMRKALTNGEYNTQNGIATIYIYDGKVYVGTSTTGKYNVVVANVEDDEFTDLSDKLDSSHYPGRITGDGQGNIFFSFQGAVCVGEGGTAGSIMKLDTKTNTVTDISPGKHLYRKRTDKFENPAEYGYSGVSVDPTNPNRMVASTCGLFSNAQLWQAWDAEHGPAWGDKFFKSEDGGETWIETTPGITPDWGQPPIAGYLQDNGYDWIRDKSIHWVGAYVIDPVNPDRSISTSGNGLFACDNTWDELPTFHFHPDGIEEVVALDFVSVPGGKNYSVIGDYDGFVHESVSEIPLQHQPNMGSTSGIAYCPSNPDIMVRVSEGSATGYYSTDAGATWIEMTFKYSNGKLSITETADGKYRIIESNGGGSNVSYTDDFGATWSDSTGINGSKMTYTLVDLNDPSIVYASGIKHNDYWASDPNKKEPTLEESHYSFYISTDYGATFKETQLERYDQCDHTGDLAYISEGTVAMATGWYGLYIISDNGANAEKTDVFYCKSIGYGAPEKEGDANTLYMYGRPTESDAEGIYRSTDVGKTWVCINDDHLYGGTGNGNFIVGDMNEFGTVYMSTVGCGIVYGKLSNESTKPDITTEPTTDDDICWGDADLSGDLTITDAVRIMSYASNPNKAEIENVDICDVYNCGDGIDSMDSLSVQKRITNVIKALPESYSSINE